MHGDQLCTDDVEYQRFRAWWADPAHRRRFLALPWFARRGIGAMLRGASRRANRGKPEAIMDVNADAVAAALREHRVSRLIHGHTHRPARHEHVVDDVRRERLVLADWYDRAQLSRRRRTRRRGAVVRGRQRRLKARRYQPSACAKSAIRSSQSSMPTERRISESAMPMLARRSGPIS